MKISKNFISEEFLSKEFHELVISNRWSPLWFINKDLVGFCEWIKKKCDNTTVVINDWYWDGSYDLSGFREPGSLVGATYSQHRFANAIDLKVKDYSPEDLRLIVLDNFDYLNKVFNITTIEKVNKTPTWFHVDCRWTGLNCLKEV